MPDRVKRVSNAVLMRVSGRRFRFYSIVEHVGRSTGRRYRNPVSAYPLGDGFVVPVLYGGGSQWVRNVLAAGGFVLRTRGETVPLERPEIIPASRALAAFPAPMRALMTRQGIDEFVWGHRFPA